MNVERPAVWPRGADLRYISAERCAQPEQNRNELHRKREFLETSDRVDGERYGKNTTEQQVERYISEIEDAGIRVCGKVGAVDQQDKEADDQELCRVVRLTLHLPTPLAQICGRRQRIRLRTRGIIDCCRRE